MIGVKGDVKNKIRSEAYKWNRKNCNFVQRQGHGKKGIVMTDEM
jgi:hypothetical protein